MRHVLEVLTLLGSDLASGARVTLVAFPVPVSSALVAEARVPVGWILALGSAFRMDAAIGPLMRMEGRVQVILSPVQLEVIQASSILARASGGGARRTVPILLQSIGDGVIVGARRKVIAPLHNAGAAKVIHIGAFISARITRSKVLYKRRFINIGGGSFVDCNSYWHLGVASISRRNAVIKLEKLFEKCTGSLGSGVKTGAYVSLQCFCSKHLRSQTKGSRFFKIDCVLRQKGPKSAHNNGTSVVNTPNSLREWVY